MKKLGRRILVFIALIYTVSVFLVPVYEAKAFFAADSEKKVYLTFDDGPIPGITERILDILKELNVKATFFVVGKEIPGREQILKRIHDEGHTIGLHTYSHKYKKVYRNEDTFLEEMLQVRRKVNEVLNITPTTIRFPGGSSKHLTKELLEKLHSNNMKVYDWNVDLYDGEKPQVPIEQIVINGERYKPQYTRIIILAHCNSNNSNTAGALPEIIRFYRNLGYEFAPIEQDTKEYHYRFK